MAQAPNTSTQLRSIPLDVLASEIATHLAFCDESATRIIEILRGTLRELPAASTEASCITRISLLEDIKSAATAGQIHETVALREHRLDREALEGVPAAQRGRGLGGEIALARRESPTAGSRFLGMARVIDADMPHALAAITNGQMNEFTATMLVREVIALPSPACRAVDEQLSSDYGDLGIKELTARARAYAYQVDPHSALARHEIARSERRVTVRPAAYGMSYLSALIPTRQAFACKKSLIDAAAVLRSSGAPDPATPDGRAALDASRSGAQMEADILVQRLTGQAAPDSIPVELTIVMTDSAAFGISRSDLQRAIAHDAVGETDSHATRARRPRTVTGSDSDGTADPQMPPVVDTNATSTSEPHTVASGSGTADSTAAPTGDPSIVIDCDGTTADPTHASAWVPGIGPLPAALARDLLDPRHDPPDHVPGSRERVHLRRILLDPITGEISAMDPRRRTFSGNLRRALILRDDLCRTPRCGAPIVHLDHTHPYALGGESTAGNGTGLCARCNYTKEYPGWLHSRELGSSALTVTTPTGHGYTSSAPGLLPRLTA